MSDRIFEDAKKFSGMFAGFLQAAEQWGQIQSLEQARGEAEKRLDAKRHEESDLDSRLAARRQVMIDQVESEMAARRAEADVYYADCQKAGHDAIDQAQKDYAELLAKAKADAEQLSVDAMSQRVDDEAKAERARKQHEELLEQIKQRQADLKELNDHIAEAGAKRTEVDRYLADLANKFAGIGVHSPGSVFPGMQR